MGKNIIAIVESICLFSFLGCTKEQSDLYTTYGQIVGETLTLQKEQLNSFYKTDISDLTLYKIDSSGDITVYVEGIDYILDKNCLMRTRSSTIPDYANHKVTYNPDGKFTWNPEPNRNPELNIQYQIYADYKYRMIRDSTVKPQNLLSEKLKNKLHNKDNLTIVTIGTSITFGAHTYQQYYHQSDTQTYPYLIAKALHNVYGSECKIINKSTDGGGVNQLQDLQSIISVNPDIVMIELGMNDHDGESPNIDYFRNSIKSAVEALKSKNIDVILIGFFQQIESWEKEYKVNTIAFNNVLKEIAQEESLYFADIYSAFEKIDKNKLYKDYTGDYMHHPTSFGHQLYYIEIMPFFLSKASSKSQLFDYLKN